MSQDRSPSITFSSPSPPPNAQQPLSLSIGREDDEVVVFEPMGNEEGNEPVALWTPSAFQKIFLHRTHPTMHPPMAISNLLKYVEENPFDTGSHGLFLVQVQKAQQAGNAPRRGRLLSYSCLVEGFRNHDVNYVDELFAGNRPIKPVFDVDLKMGRPVVESDYRTHANRVIQALSRSCGYSSDWDDWRISVCRYPNKLSMHFVLDAEVHYRNPDHLKRHLIASHVSNDLGIDLHIYHSNGSLRCLGSCKWDNNAPNPFLPYGRDPNLDNRTFKSYMAQRVSTASRLIEFEDIGESRVALIDAGSIETMVDVQEVLAFLQRNPDAADLFASTKRVESNDIVSFDVDEACLCEHRNVRAFVNHKLKTALFKCLAGVCADVRVGYTARSSQYLHQRECLLGLAKYELCAPHMPIYNSPEPAMRSFGFFDLTVEDFFAQQRIQWPDLPEGVPDWYCTFYEPEGSCLLDTEFFCFLRDYFGEYDPELHVSTTKLLVSYMRLFMCTVDTVDSWFIRSRAGIIDMKRGSVEKQFVRPLVYLVEKSVGRGENKTITLVAKQFFPIFEQHGAHHFAAISAGPFSITRRGPLCITPPKNVDTFAAVGKYEALTIEWKDCIAALLEGYFNMAVAYEPEAEQLKCKNFLTRWLCEVLFRAMTPTQVMPLLMSQGGGQGKSTLGNFIMESLGPGLSCVRNAKEMLNSQFTAESNKFTFFDEIVVGKDDSEKLKEFITARNVRVREIYKKAYQAPSYRNQLGTTNRAVCLAINTKEKERRIFCLKFLEVSGYNAAEILTYKCPHCTGLGRDEWGRENLCPHSFVDHESFIQLWYTLILEPAADGIVQTTRGVYFEPMIGLLYNIYCHIDKEVPLAQAMHLTKATSEVQIQADTEAAKFMDFCMARGFHFSPSHGPDKIGTIVEHRSVDLPRLGNETDADWEEEVTLSAFYQVYTDYCHRNNSKPQPMNYFMEEMDALSMSRRALSLKNPKLAKCEKLQWKVQFGADRPVWTNLCVPKFDGPVLNMGKAPSAWARAVGGDRIVSSGTRRTRSSSGKLSRSSSNSLLQSSGEVYAPTSIAWSSQVLRHEEATTTRSMVSKVRPREAMGVIDAVRRVAAEDERHRSLPTVIVDDVEVDEDAQDAHAAEMDTRSLYRMKKARLGGIDLEADESSGDASE